MAIITALLMLSMTTGTNHEEWLIDWNCGVHDEKSDSSKLPSRSAVSTTIGSPMGPAAPGVSPTNRVDIVFVGDGYTATELSQYASRVDFLREALFNSAPYKNYKDYFNVHRVDVISNESGVDNDPIGVFKDTALGMSYEGAGGGNSLYINTNEAKAYAQSAPAMDTIIALANSNKYGGTGYYSSSIATAPAQNGSSAELVKHEFGHSFGFLTDEYFTHGTTYTGGPLAQANASILTEEEMLASGSKWARWLGYDSNGTDGAVGVYSGASQYQFGISRPSPNSLMRSLGRPFNAPSREEVILQIYRLVKPIDNSSDPNLIHDELATLFVEPLQPVNHDLDVTWSLDGEVLLGIDSNELALCSLGLSAGWHAVEVTVVDNTPMVRNESARVQFMSQTLLFPIFSNGTTAAETYCTGAPNSAGPGAQIQFNGSTSLSANELVLRVTGAVPFSPGLFLSGTSTIEVPFGDGFRCAGGSLVRFSAQIVNGRGEASEFVDFTNFPNGLSLNSGDERSFQFWFRDPAGAGGSGFNLSNGLKLRLCP